MRADPLAQGSLQVLMSAKMAEKARFNRSFTLRITIYILV